MEERENSFGAGNETRATRNPPGRTAGARRASLIFLAGGIPKHNPGGLLSLYFFIIISFLFIFLVHKLHRDP